MAVDSSMSHSRICPAAEATVPLLPPISSANSSLFTSQMASGISDISPGSLDDTIGVTRETAGCAQESDVVTNLGSGSAPSQIPRLASVSVSGQPSREVGSHTSESAGANAPGRHRRSLLNSGLWIGVELMLTLSQVMAATFILIVSSNEKPKAPLGLWVGGYAVGCTATLPLLYWRYLQRCARSRDIGGAPAGRSVWTARRRRGDAGGEPHNPLAVPPSLQQPVRAQPSDSGVVPSGSRLLDFVDENRLATTQHILTLAILAVGCTVIFVVTDLSSVCAVQDCGDDGPLQVHAGCLLRCLVCARQRVGFRRTGGAL